MGQYYKVVNIDKEEVVTSYDVDSNGAKLMEHSFKGNCFVGAIMTLLKNKWKGDRVIWLGDYYEIGENPKVNIDWGTIKKYKTIIPKPSTPKRCFINNITQKKSIDLTACTITDRDYGDWALHPLSLLTACGNGKGGGDFSKEDAPPIAEYIGAWAGDTLSVTSKPLFNSCEEQDAFDTRPNSIKYILGVKEK